jgi:hypothetical protein
MPGVRSMQFELFLFEHSTEFSLGKRSELAEGQVCHDQPLVSNPCRLQDACQLR